MPKVTIVIPVYNAQEYLKETLQSVKNQSFLDFECIIVNDGSTDNSLKIIEEYVENDDRFKCISIENSGCANIPRNIAIRNAQGQFVFNLDSDDTIEIDCINKMVSRQLTTEADIILLRMIGYTYEIASEIWRLPLMNFNMEAVLNGVDACKLTIGGWQIPCNGMLAKKELFQNVSEGNLFISDEISSRHLLYKAKKVAFSESNYYYRNHNFSITRSMTPRLFERLLIDELLDDFVTERFNLEDDVVKTARKARFFNMIYLFSEFQSNKSFFTKQQSSLISHYFRNAFNTQNKIGLKSEFSFILFYMFLSSFVLFKLFAPTYVFIKKIRGKKYYYK